MEAFVAANVRPLPSEAVQKNDLNTTLSAMMRDLYPVLNDAPEETNTEEKRIGKAILQLSSYPTLVELQSIINQQKSTDKPVDIEPPSIEPLKNFLEKRAITIDGLKKLRTSMIKHIKKCKISNTAGSSASIIGGILCFFFPMIGVPVLLAGSATSLGTFCAEKVFLIS